MYAIAAVSRNYGIGLENDLLFHIPEDLKFFHRTTLGHTIVIGRRNLESFPGGRPLKDRRHLVLTRQTDYTAEGCEVFHDLKELFARIRDLPEDEVWLCGGGIVYEELLPYCSGAWITEVDAEPEADTFFPPLERLDSWKRTETSEWMVSGDLRYRFCHWKNLSPLSPEASL